MRSLRYEVLGYWRDGAPYDCGTAGRRKDAFLLGDVAFVEVHPEYTPPTWVEVRDKHTGRTWERRKDTTWTEECHA